MKSDKALIYYFIRSINEQVLKITALKSSFRSYPTAGSSLAFEMSFQSNFVFVFCCLLYSVS